jgi:hypothetical protein
MLDHGLIGMQHKTMTQQEARQWLWPRLVAHGWSAWDEVMDQATPAQRQAVLGCFPNAESAVADFFASLEPQPGASWCVDDRPWARLFEATMTLVDALWDARHLIRSALVYASPSFYWSVALSTGQWMKRLWNMSAGMSGGLSAMGLGRWPQWWWIMGSWLLFWVCFGYALSHEYEDVLATVDQWAHGCVQWWESVVLKTSSHPSC